MRIQRAYPFWQLWTQPEAISRWLHLENLVAVRMEPATRRHIPISVMDCVFRDGQRYQVVPGILVDVWESVLREKDALVWPEAVALHATDDATFGIEDRLHDWMRALTMGMPQNHEQILHLGTQEDREVFEAARAANFLGAAKVADVATALSPYVYASRYAFGKRVYVGDCVDAAAGAAYLNRIAAGVRVQGGAAHEALAQKWFPALQNCEGPFELVVCSHQTASTVQKQDGAAVVCPDEEPEDGEQRCVTGRSFAMDLVFAFDTEQSSEARTFSVSAPLRAPTRAFESISQTLSIEGEGANVALCLRPDWQRVRGADTDSALQLERLLREAGWNVQIVSDLESFGPERFDLVHIINLIEPTHAFGFARKARSAGCRVVLTAGFVDVAEERHWGAVHSLNCFEQEMDEAYIALYFRFLERRALLSGDWQLGVRRGIFPNYDTVIKETLALCDAVIGESDAEVSLLKNLYGFQGALYSIAPLLRPAQGAAVPLPVGFERFTLIHAPLAQQYNQLLAVRAAMEVADARLVVAGNIGDFTYAALVRSFADDRVVFLNEPDEAQCDWLYGSADAFLDPSWYGTGLARTLRAVLAGAKVFVSKTSWAATLFKGGVTIVDPAVTSSLGAAMSGGGAAVPPSTRASLAAALDPGALLRNIIAAYKGGLVARL